LLHRRHRCRLSRFTNFVNSDSAIAHLLTPLPFSFKVAPQFEVDLKLLFQGPTLAATVIIPARYASTRFPGKVLAAETGRPLVQHVVDQARKCTQVREIIVAADDPRIVEAVKPFETRCVLTSPKHQSGTDRIAEVAEQIEDDIVVNVQGDEPEIEPRIIDDLILRLAERDDDMATAATPFPGGADAADPNLVKVVLSHNSHALYFSRLPIPYWRDRESSAAPAYYLHLGIYAYQRRFLLDFASWKPTPCEQAEKLEQLRALEHGRSIFVLKVERATHGIDTRAQYDEFVRRVGMARHET
jgi:3-deoxy-manno-octulosonate cytidylyltransferase (CMP-KDO synthetase)